MDQLTLTEDQTRALAEFLRRYSGSDALTITRQGDGSVVMAFTLATWEVTAEGTVFPEDGEEVNV